MISLSDKLAFLQAPGSYPDSPAAVETVQTHMSFVFLTPRFAYKLKKPVRYDFLDFSTLASRKLDCEEEVRLNRRLAPSVYLGVVPLTASLSGRLSLDGDGVPVEWLVKMRRLPKRLMLDQAIAANTVPPAAIRKFAGVLADFYERAPTVLVEPARYRARFARDIAVNAMEVARDEYGVHRETLSRITERQLAFLHDHPDALDERARLGRIVEGHGDLRPEHVCLLHKPVVIDCLEFNRELRIVDVADELAYLALECEFAGAPNVGHAVFVHYGRCTGDVPPRALVNFYQSCRAMLRAKLAAWHLADVTDQTMRQKWLDRAHAYLSFAARHAALLRDSDRVSEAVTQ